MIRYSFIFLILLGAVLSPPVYAQMQRIPFQGNMNFLEQSLHVQLLPSKDGSVEFQAQKVNEKQFHIKVNVNRLETPFSNFSGEVESLVDVFRQSDGSFRHLSGKLTSRDFLVNFQPVTQELRGRFELVNNRLMLDSIVFDNIALKGFMDFFYPFNLDLTMGLSGISMDQFLNFFYRSRTFESDGLVIGDMRLSGSMDRLALKANLIGQNGFVDNLDFERIFINGEGVYPHFELTNSSLVKKEGFTLSIKGAVDLMDFKYFKKQITALTLAPIVSDSQGERQWTIKTEGEDGSRMKTELKSILRDKAADQGQKEKSGMIGIQKTMEF